jgi:hypothetical protein
LVRVIPNQVQAPPGIDRASVAKKTEKNADPNPITKPFHGHLPLFRTICKQEVDKVASEDRERCSLVFSGTLK